MRVGEFCWPDLLDLLCFLPVREGDVSCIRTMSSSTSERFLEWEKTESSWLPVSFKGWRLEWELGSYGWLNEDELGKIDERSSFWKV